MNFSEKRNILLLCALLFFFLAGESIILPILAPTLAEPVCDKLDMLANASKQLHNLAYGAALGVFPVCLFFAAPIIGSLSDNYARKPLIIAAVAGAFLSYILQGLAMQYMLFLPFFVGRAVAGLTTGVDGVIQAYLLDNCPAEKRAKYLSYTLFAMSIGLFVGPMFAAALIDPHSTEPLSWSVPFYGLAAVFLVILIPVIYFLPKRSKNALANKKTKLDWLAGIKDLKSSWREVDLRKLSIPFIIVNAAFGCYMASSAVWVEKSLGFNMREISLFFSVGGVASFFTYGLFAPKLIGKFGAQNVAKYSAVLIGVATFAMLVLRMGALPYVFMAFNFAGISLFYLSCIDIYSGLVSAQRRGWMLSVASSLWGLAQGLGLALSGFICAYIGAFGGMVFCGIFALFSYYIFPNLTLKERD